MSETAEGVAPLLAPPGAGLPKPELWIARLILRRRARRATRATTTALFARERVAVLHLVRSDDPEGCGRRVLIKRLRGLEDSSRYWSVFMTLDHLGIVNRQIAETVRLLGREETPTFAASTAGVKPRVDVDGKVIEEFEGACDHLERCVAGVKNLRTRARLSHPWFGLLDAADWYFTAAFHLQLHRHQIEAIRQARRLAD